MITTEEPKELAVVPVEEFKQPEAHQYVVVTNGRLFAVARIGGDIIIGTEGTRSEAERIVEKWNEQERLKGGKWRVV